MAETIRPIDGQTTYYALLAQENIMQNSNTDRWLGTFCTIFVLVFALFVFRSISLSWWWVLLFFWTIGLGAWTWSGFRKIEIGWGGQLLYLGQRMNYFFDEGWRWAPFPFNIKCADRRQKVIKLDILEKIITSDNVQVEIEGSIIRQIVDLDKYFGVEEASLKLGLDEIWDETIRNKVADTTLANVLKMHVDLSEETRKAMREAASKNWGIEILRVIVASIKPDPKVADDLALTEREKLQKKGQKVEAGNITALMNMLMKPKSAEDEDKDNNKGLTQDQAYETALFITGKAAPKNVTGFTFSPEILEAITKIVGRK